MDLFGQFNDSIIELFDTNVYLTTGTDAQVFAQDSDEETEDERLKTINARLNLVGVVGSLSSLRIDRQEGDRFVCKGGLFWEINKKKNLSDDGTQKPGRLIFQESLAILKRFQPVIVDDLSENTKPFSGILINWAERLGEDEGVELWAIEFETRVAL